MDMRVSVLVCTSWTCLLSERPLQPLWSAWGPSFCSSAGARLRNAPRAECLHAEVAAKGSTGGKAQEQEQQVVSDPDSPMLDPNKKPGGPVDLETAAHDGVFSQFVADQLLSQGQRINIGSPDTYFRPAYATAAGVKSAPDAEDPGLARGRLQV